VWHNQGVEAASADQERGNSRRRRVARPLDHALLQELALAYVARFATSRAKLLTYLRRKVRERGWSEEAPPELDRLADRITKLGFLDDQAYAAMKAGSLLRRGYGKARVRSALIASGIGEEDRAEALDAAEAEKVTAALRFAERRRLGPYAAEAADPDRRQRALAALMRAGHGLDLARKIVAAAPGDFSAFDPDD